MTSEVFKCDSCGKEWNPKNDEAFWFKLTTTNFAVWAKGCWTTRPNVANTKITLDFCSSKCLAKYVEIILSAN